VPLSAVFMATVPFSDDHNGMI